jgi:hypothetical protein
MNNNGNIVYVVYRWSEGGDENSSTVLGVYSNLDKADAVAYTRAKAESTSDGVQLYMEIGIIGLRTYVFDPSEEDRTHYEVSVKMLDADPSVLVNIQLVYTNPPPIQQTQAPQSSIFQPSSMPVQVHPGIFHQQGAVYQQLIEQKLRRSNLRQKIDSTIEQYLKTPNHTLQSMSLMQSNDPWAELNQHVLWLSGIPCTDSQLNYAKAYISDKLAPLFMASHPDYVKRQPLQTFGGDYVHEQDRKVDEQLLQVQGNMGLCPPQVPYPFSLIPQVAHLMQQPPNPFLYKGPAQIVSIPPPATQVPVQLSSYEQRLKYRETIERTVEQYIASELKDFEGIQDAVKQMNPEFNKVALIEYQMTKFCSYGILTDTQTAYDFERAYADAYIEERARALVTILDPDYIWSSYKGQVFAGKVAQMRSELEKQQRGEVQFGRGPSSGMVPSIMSMVPQPRNN